jgi:hypothetical protein
MPIFSKSPLLASLLLGMSMMLQTSMLLPLFILLPALAMQVLFEQTYIQQVFSDNYDVVAVIIHNLGNRTNFEEQVWHSVYIFTLNVIFQKFVNFLY